MPKDRSNDPSRVPDILKGRVANVQAEYEHTMKDVRSSLNSEANYQADQKNSRRFDEGHKGII
jgi:hypothetical protein